MSNEELMSQIAQFIAAAYQVDAAGVTPETTFEELGGGSMKMIALVSTIENELDVEVTIHEVMKMKAVAELVERVAEEVE